MSADNFASCLAFTLKYEGGKSNDPRDPGGRTMEGVTQAAYDAYRDKCQTARRDVYMMPRAERDAIYHTEYWNTVTGNSLPRGVDLCMFDFAVNSGPARALRAYATVAHGRKPADAVHAVCSARMTFLHALGTWSTFGIGWGKRVAACEARALKMAGASLEDARDNLQAKKRGAATGAVISFGAGMAAMLHNLHLHWWELAIAAVVLALIVLSFIGKSRQAGLRVDSLDAAIAELKAKRDSFEQTTKAAEARVASETAAITQKQRDIAAAQASLDALRLKPLEKK